MRAAQCLVAIALTAGCGAGQSVVNVQVSAAPPITGVARIMVTVTATGTSMPVYFLVQGGSIPPEQTVHLVFDKSVSGPATIIMTAQASSFACSLPKTAPSKAT